LDENGYQNLDLGMVTNMDPRIKNSLGVGILVAIFGLMIWGVMVLMRKPEEKKKKKEKKH
jgi:hypothetical protein